MRYYELAREVRENIARGGAEEGVWRGRLGDLAVRVGGALVEMGDLMGALGHLEGIGGDEDGRVGVARTLLWLRVGDVDAARGCVGDGPAGEVVGALCDMANGDYEGALGRWEGLRGMGDEMVGVNMGVCLVYLGRINHVSLFIASGRVLMGQGRRVMEGLVDGGTSRIRCCSTWRPCMSCVPRGIAG